MIKGLTYAILITPDVPRARRFFTEKLGLTTEDDAGDSFSQFTTRAGTMWAISSPSPDDSPSGIELFLEVEDPDEAYRVWKDRGVEMLDQPHDAEWGRSFTFKDADGRILHAWRPT